MSAQNGATIQFESRRHCTYIYSPEQVAAHALAATHIAVFVVVELLPLVRNVRSAHVATGVGNVLGNKGGVAVSLR